MELFLDSDLTFEKLGYEARLSEEVNNWPQEILDELYRQAPFTSDYTPKVVLRTVDQDRRYALGHVELLNKLAINPRDDKTPEGLRGQQKVILPVIVKEGKLLPMDLFLHSGVAEPLVEERLRKAIFRPTLFEAIKKRPGDVSLIEQLYPPHRAGGHAGGPLVSAAGSAGIRTASAKAEFLMDEILPSIKTAHIEQLEQRMDSDPSLRAALLNNEAVKPFLLKLGMKMVEGDQSGRAYFEKVAHSIKPTVVQIQRIQGGFRIKTAAPQALIPTADDVDRPTAVGTLGGDLVNRVETDGTVTLTSQPAVKETMEDIVVKVVNEFGIYKVRTVGTNKELVGWVFPKVMDLGGELLPLAAFSNGSESAMQENIAGVPIDRATDIIDAPPDGHGVFYFTRGSGATALVPVTVRSETEMDGQKAFICVTVLGDGITIKMVEGLKTIEKLDEGTVCIPEECGFMPLPNNVELVSVPDDFTKTGEAMTWKEQVRISTDGLLYKFNGHEIDKLAGVMETDFLEKDDAVFLGAVLGQEPEKLAHDLDMMRGKGEYHIDVKVRPVDPFKDKYAMAKTAAAEQLSKLPSIRADLLKEAAPLEDPGSVDKVLSLGFVNPENIMVFASYVPEFENTIKKLSELLMASRLGLSAVDEGALQKSLVHMDKVVAGLRNLTAVPQA